MACCTSIRASIITLVTLKLFRIKSRVSTFDRIDTLPVFLRIVPMQCNSEVVILVIMFVAYGSIGENIQLKWIRPN